MFIKFKKNCFFVFVFILHLSLFSNPQTPSIVNGKATVNNLSKNMLEITASNGAIINWQDFSIGIDEITKIIR